MSMATGASGAGLKTLTGADNHGHKARSTAEVPADGLGDGGFLALLMSLEPESGLSTEVASGTDLSADFVAPTFTQDSTTVSMLPSPSPQHATAQNAQQDLSMLLAQANAVDLPGADAHAGVVTQGAVFESSTLPATKLSDFSRVMNQGSWRAPANANDGSAQAIERPIDVLSAGADLTGQNVAPQLGQMEQLVPARPVRSRGAELQTRGTNLPDSRRSSTLDVLPVEVQNLGALRDGGVAEGAGRQVDAIGARPFTSSGAHGADGIWGQQGSIAGAGTDPSSVMTDASMTALESMVADTVSYWVTQGIQNAELTLDGQGADPVDVSISLKGDEAQIEFRSDQPEIRQVLEGASAYLKDLLAKEGLILSGVSVGAFSQQGTGAQDQRHRQGGRHAGVPRVEVASSDSRPRAVQSLTGAVDIFV